MTPILKRQAGTPRARLVRPKGLGGWGMGRQGPMSPYARHWPIESITRGAGAQGQAERRTEARGARLIYSKDTLAPVLVFGL